MSDVLDRPAQPLGNGWVPPRSNGGGAAVAAAAWQEPLGVEPGTVRPGWLSTHPAWPITALLLAYPLWWALGVADFMWFLLAIPMLSRMAAWRASGRKIKTPPGFGLWLAFLVCAVAGALVLGLAAPNTVSNPISHRILSYVNRTTEYLGLTVLLLFACNLTERELARKRLAYLFGLFAIYVTVGGVGGIIAPHFSFSSPTLLLVPHSLRSNLFIQASMHPGLSQIQNVLGTAKGRPKAPFDYTDLWGESLTMLAPWLLVGWWSGGTRRQRQIAAGTLVVAIGPLLYSLDRGAWIGAVLAVVYLAVRLAARGKTAMLAALMAALALGAVVFLATPAKDIITGRLHNGKSNNLRSNLSGAAITAAVASPIIGYGDTRQLRGSPSSIAIGRSVSCPDCGQQPLGSNGQLWLLLVCTGFVGTFFYLAFFGYGIWRFRRDRSPYGLAGVLVLVLGFLYMFTYTAIGAPLGITMIVYALLWKNERFNEAAALGVSEGDAFQLGGVQAEKDALTAGPATTA